MQKQPIICEYNTYSVKPFINDTFNLDFINENDLEQKILCKIYLGEEYNDTNPQITHDQNNKGGYRFENYLLKKTIDNTTYTTCMSICTRRQGIDASYESFSEPYLITYDIDSIGDTLRGIHSYKIDMNGLYGCNIDHTLDGYLGISIEGIYMIFGIEEVGIANERKYIFRLPPKSILLEGIHRDVIEKEFFGDFQLGRRSIIKGNWYNSN